jgi:hypothetical protein
MTMTFPLPGWWFRDRATSHWTLPASLSRVDVGALSLVLDILGGAQHVSILGRSGHIQGAFTIKVSPKDAHALIVFICVLFARHILVG